MYKSYKVTLPGFGEFSTELSPEEQKRNPLTGFPLLISASDGVTFKPLKELKSALN